MKNLILLTLLFSLFTLTAFGQEAMVYSKVEVKLDEHTSVQTLADAGIGIDHVHKHGDHLAFILNEEELALLKNSAISFEVLVPDMTAQYLGQLKQSENNLAAMDCGLQHFDEGEMGGYHSYDDMVRHINLMQQEFPNIVQVTEIGKSIEDRSVYAVKISDNVASNESSTEGVVYYDAITHAREPMGLETHLYYMWWLLENYGTDPEATYLVDQREIYFVPVVNPDGYVYNQTNNPLGGGFWRKNRRDNGDGTFGVDLNRNYSYDWGELWGASNSPSSDTYHGESAFSEPESQNVRDFVASIEPAIAFSCHTYTDVMISPEDFGQGFPELDVYYDFASEFMPAEYKAYGPALDLIGYAASGTTQDYLHSEGIYSYTPEIGHSFWEQPENICDRVQEMFGAMKYLTWVSGDYATLNSYELINLGQIWKADELDLMVRIKNKGLTRVSQEIVVKASSSSSKVTFIEEEVTINSLLPRKTKESTSPLRFTLNDDFLPGEEIPIRLTIMQDGVVSATEELVFRAGVQEVLFLEDCEIETAQWDITGDAWATTELDAYGGIKSIGDSPNGNYLSEVLSDLTLKTPIDLSLVENPFLEFRAKWSLEGPDDLVQLQISDDNGLTWNNLETEHMTTLPGYPKGYTHTQHWIQERIDLKDYIGKSEVRFRFAFSSDYWLQGDGFYFDDFRVMNYSQGTTVSTSQPASKEEVSLYPNPNTGKVWIEVNRTSATDAIFNISDVTGKIIASKRMPLESGRQTIELELEHNGFYFVEMETRAGTKQIFRVLTLDK